MEDLSTGRRFTYAEFDRRVSRLASGLRQRYGVALGDTRRMRTREELKVTSGDTT